MDFKNKTLVITGCASGIGYAILKEFVKNKANVAGLDYNDTAIKNIKNEFKTKGYDNVQLYKVNVTNKNEIEDAVKKIYNIYGKIDYWVNAAGISHIVPFLETSEKIWDDTLNVNLKGQFLSCQVAIKYMLKNKKGSIVNISSQSGKKGTNCYAPYCASKAGVIALTQSIAKEFANKNIRCNDICPGVIQTPMWDAQLSDYARKKGIKDEEVMPHFIKDIPLQRLGTTKDIVNVVEFLLSDKSSYMTGQSLNITGGSWMW